jgi:SAM-dependent methyltransferase
MNRFLHGVARAVAENFSLPEPILEVGAHWVAGQEDIADLRPFFPGKQYIGLDLQPGPGVDLVGDVENLPQKTGSVGTVLAMNTLEHVQRFWRALDEIHRVLRPDGALLISCPFYFHIHSYPSDYWRFSPQALEFLLEKYPQRIIGSHGPRKRPANVWALAFREECRRITPLEIERYRAGLARYAHEPLPWRRGVRYRLARWFCGRGPFAPYLDREKWEMECRTSIPA